MNLENKRAVNALLEVYGAAINNFKELVVTIPGEKLTLITDSVTADSNCNSIQSILTHVVHSGYGYATYIHNNIAVPKERPPKAFHSGIQQYLDDLENVLQVTREIFDDISDAELYDVSRKIDTSWDQTYDIEQLMEHAIVHILRHHRQVKNIIDRDYADIATAKSPR